MKTTKIYGLQSLNFMRNCKLKVGILGGSFNPAHGGHLETSLKALKLFKFDYIVWLVAMQNPDKEEYKYDIFTRAQNATKIVNHPRILISTAEYDIGGPYYTYHPLKVLTQRFNKVTFTWLMGSDNVNSFYKWDKYEKLVKLCNIIIFDRPGYKLNPQGRFQSKLKATITNKQLDNNIIFYYGARSYLSSTGIREKLNYD